MIDWGVATTIQNIGEPGRHNDMIIHSLGAALDKVVNGSNVSSDHCLVKLCRSRNCADPLFVIFDSKFTMPIKRVRRVDSSMVSLQST